tara:strand:+ start:61 stop:255 length:195 start_codon:yes stop_codon:yes gene_type:complete
MSNSFIFLANCSCFVYGLDMLPIKNQCYKNIFCFLALVFVLYSLLIEVLKKPKPLYLVVLKESF